MSPFRCTSCVSSKWSCNWCVMENKCVDSSESCASDRSSNRAAQVWPSQHLMRHHKPNANTRKAFMFGGSSVAPVSSSKQVSQCPHIDTRDLPEVLLPSGQPFAIRIPVVNLDKMPTANRIGSLDCVTVIDRKEVRVRGWLSEDRKTVTCESHEVSSTIFILD